MIDLRKLAEPGSIEKRLDKVDFKRLPRHIAVMDGIRWARARNLPRVEAPRRHRRRS
jgi:hypothetical protein